MRLPLTFLLLVGLSIGSPAQAQPPPGREQAPADLNRLAGEFRTARRAFTERGDFSAKAIETQKAELRTFRSRLDALPRTTWPIADQVDWFLLLSEMNALDFEQRVKRSTSRDPGFYVSYALSSVQDDPDDFTSDQAGAVAARLKAVPALYDQARVNLTEASRQHGELALRTIEQVRGVRVQQSAIGRFRWFAAQTASKYPELSKAAEGAAEATLEYGRWIRQNLATMTAPGHVGLANFNWYLHNVLLMPFTAEELLVLAERDLTRTVADLAYEENRNRNLPPIELPKTEAEYARRVKEVDELVRRWFDQGNIITIDPAFGPLGATVPWKEGGRVGQVTPIHYWQEIQFRDPLPDHLHAGIPGHRYDGWVLRRHARAIRQGHSDRGRSEGWGFYLEELALQSDLLKDRPRTRELFYNFQLFRYVRMHIDIKMAAGEMTPAQAVAHQKSWVPMMEDQVAWSEGHGYFLNPSGGTVYTAGKYQIEGLVARLRHQLGDAFNLHAFHDRFMEAGAVPIALIEWELTGSDAELRKVVGRATTVR